MQSEVRPEVPIRETLLPGMAPTAEGLAGVGTSNIPIDVGYAIEVNNRYGYTSGEIELIQDVVGARPTRVFDEQTVLAVSRWQRQNGLTDDGIVGRGEGTETWAAIQETANETRSEVEPSTPIGETARQALGEVAPLPESGGLLTPVQQEGVKALLEEMMAFSRDAALFVAGAFYQWLDTNSEPGRWVLEAISLGTSTASDDAQIVEQQLPTDAAFVTGRTFGDAAALVQGILQMIAGGGAIGSGGALCFTGVGCIAGSGAVAAGVVTATHGASVVVTATGNMARDLAELINAAHLAISSGSGGNGGDTDNINWNSTSRPTFGHTFNRHGAGQRNTRRLRGRAASNGQEQGQWLDNERAAEFLRNIYPNISGPTIVDIPEGLGQVIMPDGSIVPATRAYLVPNPRGVYRTAYPILDAP